MNKNNNFYIGTSGYMCSQKEWWELNIFNSLEIDSTFYGRPQPSTWIKWYQAAPAGFLYSPKMNRYMTHTKRLINAQEIWHNFWDDGAELLKDKLGCVLFQFPPSFHNTNSKSAIDNKTSFERLQELATILPKNVRFAFEFRHSSWFCKTVYEFLRKQNWCLVNVYINNQRKWVGDLESGFIPQIPTTDFMFIRLHGSAGKFKGEYTEAQLKEVRAFCLQSKTKQNFVYFNNTFFANRGQSCQFADKKTIYAALCNAAEFTKLVSNE